ncbi:MAG: POTRA domain-containing protein [Vulcanimicrobiota bacterium]
MREGRRVIPFLAILMILLFQCTVFTSADARKKTPPKKSQTTETTTIEENVTGEVIQADASQPAGGDKTDTAAPPAGGDKTDTAAPPAQVEPGSAAPAVNDGKTEGGKTETPKTEGNETKDTPAVSPTPEEGAPAPKAGEDKKEASETPSPEGTNEVAPRITAVVIDGNNSVSTDEIIQVISTKIGDPVVESKIQRDIQAIFDTGYFTDVRVDTRYFVGGVKLIFHVLENPVVKEIVMEGNKIVPTSKLLEKMETKVGKILNTKELYADLNVINQYYDEDLGYLLRPTHIRDLQWTEDGKLVVSLQEGMVIQEIEVTGATMYPADQLKKFISLKNGDLFNQKVLKKDTDKIAKFYEKKDYILDTIRPNIDPTKGLVSVRVIEAVVESIRIEGNKRTKDYVVLRNINTKVGQVLKRKRLQKDIERLNNLGYFSSVNIDPEAGSEQGKVVLVLKLKEQKTGLATIGLGYTGGGSSAIRTGVTGAISLSERNYKGKGIGGSVQWQRGVNVDSLSGSVFMSAINDKRDSIGFSIYRNQMTDIQQSVTGSNPVVYALYNDFRTGGAFTYGHPLNDDLSMFLTLKSENIQLSQSPNSDYIPLGMGSGTSNSAILSAVYDTRDDLFNPHQGGYLNASYQTAGGILSGDYQFNKAQLEVRRYIPVWKNKTIALRAWGGVLDGNAGSTDYFYVGGADTIRAYQDNTYYGTRMVVLNAEFRFPIAKIKILSGAVFADAGNAWFPGMTSTLYTDVGVGLRLVFPTLGLGVIRIDYAFGQNGSRSTIGIGQTF